MVSAVPASGPKVLPLAKVLSQNLVDGSCDLQTAKRNGQSIIGFLSKLSSIIALNVPEALEDLQSLQWKDLPLIPVVDEIHKPSKFQQNNEASKSLGLGSARQGLNPTLVTLLCSWARHYSCSTCLDVPRQCINGCTVLCRVKCWSNSHRMLGTHVQWAVALIRSTVYGVLRIIVLSGVMLLVTS